MVHGENVNLLMTGPGQAPLGSSCYSRTRHDRSGHGLTAHVHTRQRAQLAPLMSSGRDEIAPAEVTWTRPCFSRSVVSFRSARWLQLTRR